MHLALWDSARIAVHLLAAFRSFRPCEQPLLFADRAGHRHAPARRVGGLGRHDQRRIVPNRLAGLRHTLISPRDGTLCALASIFLVVTLIHAIETGKFVASWIDYRDAIADAGDEQQFRPRARRSALCLGRANFASSRSPIVVLDYPLSVNHSLELLAEPAGHRSRRKLLLVILRNGNKEQGCASLSFRCRPASWSGFIRACIDKPGTIAIMSSASHATIAL